MGDYRSGNVYVLSPDNYNDAGAFIQRVRIAPHLNDEQKTIFYHELAIDMTVGAASPLDPNPMATLSWSNDGGITWSNQRTCSMGLAGQYQQRVRWNQLGKARRRAFQFMTSAEVPVCLVDAYLRVTEGSY